MGESAESEIGKGVAEEIEKETEVIKVRPSKINFAKDGSFLVLRLNLVDLHRAVGELRDLELDLLNAVRAPRLMAQQADRVRKEKLRGGSGVINGIKQNKGFFKKFIK